MPSRCRCARRESCRSSGGGGPPPPPPPPPRRGAGRAVAAPPPRRRGGARAPQPGAARQEVVRTLAKLQTVASRAEAASAMAEAEIAVQSLRAATGAQPAGSSDVAQAGTLLQQGSAEFAKQNYGGALYLANQAKNLAGLGRRRLGGARPAPPTTGQRAIAVAAWP